jgi:hypothetical protein
MKMGTKREVLGLVVEVGSYRKSGNGAKGGGRKGNSGKRAKLFKFNKAGEKELLESAEGPTGSAAIRDLKSKTRMIPPHVAISNKGETHF